MGEKEKGGRVERGQGEMGRRQEGKKGIVNRKMKDQMSSK
jgi:hypothetical protein